jgi:hypothetical protein
MVPVRLWRHSRWLTLLVAFFVCLIVALLVVSLTRPRGALIQVLGPLIIAWAFGAVSGILIAGDVLTRDGNGARHL